MNQNKKNSTVEGISQIKRCLFSLTAFILLICILEGILRMLPDQNSNSQQNEALPLWVISNMENSNFIPDRILFWRVPKNTPRLNTNSWGLRGLEFSKHKESDVFRIITLGDSCTWGFGVKQTEEYPWVLQRLLNQSAIPVVFEVQNAGIPGFSSLQALRYLKHELLNYQPDLLTIYLGRNDHRNLREEGGYAPDHEVRIPSFFVYNMKSLLNHSKLFNTLRSILFKAKAFTGSNNPVRGNSARKGRSYRVEADEFEQNITEIIKIAQDNKIHAIMITSPVFPRSVGNYNPIIRKVTSEKQVTLIDAEPVFFSHRGNGWLVDDCHPNREGHLWLAHALYKQIINFVTSPKAQ